MTVTNGVDADRLRTFIERIERLELEKAAIAADIKDIYAELKGAGYDVKTTRAVIKLRKMESDAREEQEQLLDLYKHALGMLADLPLGEAAIEREVSPVRKAVRKVQAARPATPHDPTTGEVLGDDPAPTAVVDDDSAHSVGGVVTEVAAAETNRITRAIAEEFGRGAETSRATSGPEVATPYRIEPHTPAPAPDWPEMPAGLDRRNWEQGSEAAE